MIQSMEEKHLKIAELFEEEPKVLEIIQKRKKMLAGEFIPIDKKMTEPYSKSEWYVILKYSIEKNNEEAKEIESNQSKI